MNHGQSEIEDTSPADESTEPLPPEPAPAPRPITPRAARRSWQELSVRVWTVLAMVLAVITVYFTVSKVLEGRELRWLLSQGQAIDATVYEINGTKQRIVFKRSDPLRVWVQFQLPGHNNVVGERMLTQLPDPKQTIRVGDKLPIRVDPKDIQPLNEIEKPGVMLANTWTDRAEAPPWHVEYTVVLLLVPLLLIVAVIMFWRRARVLGVWKNGESALATVIGHRHTAIAPRSRIMRFTLEDGDDRRVFNTLHPVKDLPPVGDVFWVVYPQGNPGRAIAAKLYQ